MQFFKWLLSKIRSALKRNNSAGIIILEEYHANDVSVVRFADHSVPGLIEIWKITRHQKKYSFWISLINIAAMRQDLALQKTTLEKYAATNRKTSIYTSVLEQAKQQQTKFDTHYWICGFSIQSYGIDKQGRHYQTQRLKDINFVSGDFQGYASVYAGDRYIRLFARKVVQALASNEFREFRHHRTWEGAVASIDWLEWLEGLGRRHIDAHHSIQPGKK